MKEVNYSQLVDLLGKPLASESIKASEILLFKDSLQIPRGPGLSIARGEELRNRFYELGIGSGGIICMPVQYCNGEYTDMKDDEKTFLDQGLATVFNPDFFEGKSVRTDEGEPYRPFVDGYLDFRDEKSLEGYLWEVDDKGNINPEFERAEEFKKGLWIGGLAENNAEDLVREHIKQFSRLYKMKEFLREPEKGLVRECFSPYRL